MKHICVFLAFNNPEHVQISFDSLYMDNVDYFIIENPSENSKKISEYFKTKKLKGYIQFEKNVAANAVNTFIINYRELLLEYDYITITDGDIYVHNIEDTFNELKSGLEITNSLVSSVDLYMGNNYTNNPNRVIGTNYYDDFMVNSQKSFGCIYGNTGNFLLTIKRENIDIIENIHYIDTYINSRVLNLGKIWVKTNKNLGYHLTWDSYIDDNPYYEWKKAVYPSIWAQSNEICEFKNMLKEKVIIGAGGFAREIRAHIDNKNIKFYVSDKYYTENNDNIYPLSSFDSNNQIALIGIGDPKDKKVFIDQLPKDTEYWSFVSPKAIILDDNVEIGEGSFICAGVIITTNVKIGKHVQLNLLTTVGHDTIIGDFFTSAPDVNISGNVEIGDFVYMGTNSTIKEKIKITDNVIIGMNCGVVSDITESGVYVGTPNKKIK
jgi:sugar O-acyltransferase (sialic acid O-acetyltransferase NeuD family)